MKIGVWSETTLYGGIIFLIKGLRKFHQTDFCVLNQEPYKYGPDDVKPIYYHQDPQRVKQIINDCDMIIVSASVSLRYLMSIVGYKDLSKKPIAVLIGDSHFCNNCNQFVKPLMGRTEGGFNALLKENGVKGFVMPDKYQFCDFDPIPYFPPIEIPKEYIFPKHKGITVLHLPGSVHKQYEKGTSEILDVFERIKAERSDIRFLVPPQMDWKNCVKLKSQCHVYVDQLVKGNKDAGVWRYRNTSGIKYDGGLGKAGIESMYVGALTMASGNDVSTLPYFPRPPVVWIDKTNFEHVLRSALNTESMYYALSNQIKWARKYATPDFMAKHILENMK